MAPIRPKSRVPAVVATRTTSGCSRSERARASDRHRSAHLRSRAGPCCCRGTEVGAETSPVRFSSISSNRTVSRVRSPISCPAGGYSSLLVCGAPAPLRAPLRRPPPPLPRQRCPTPRTDVRRRCLTSVRNSVMDPRGACRADGSAVPGVDRIAAERRTFGRVAVTEVRWSVVRRRDVLRVSVSRVPTSRSAELRATGPRSPGRCRCCRTSRVLSRRVSTGTTLRRRRGPRARRCGTGQSPRLRARRVRRAPPRGRSPPPRELADDLTSETRTEASADRRTRECVHSSRQIRMEPVRRYLQRSGAYWGQESHSRRTANGAIGAGHATNARCSSLFPCSSMPSRRPGTRPPQ